MTNPLLADFKQLYKQNITLVRRVIASFRFTNGTADDLAQQTFLKAYEKLDTLKDPKLFPAWVATIARNFCLEDLRRAKPTVQISGTDSNDPDQPSVSDYELGLWIDPEAGQAEIELENNLSLVSRILRDYRKEPRGTVARLYYVDGLNTREIADQIKMPQNTILSHLHKFRNEIKGALVQALA